MLEKYLISHCSPTLASLKSASLFSCKCTSEDDICGIIKTWNEKLKSRGVEISLLHRSERKALIYVYRKSALANALNNPEVRDYLSSCGYDACYCCEGCDASSCSIENCLRHLRCRISEGRENGSTYFPHEIGLFLDYPLADVIGFIQNKGRDFTCVGSWKVYGDISKAEKTFAGFKKCNDVYNRLWKSGRRSVLELTVAG